MNEKIKIITVSALWIMILGLIISTIVWLCYTSPSVALIVVTLSMLAVNVFLATIVTALIMTGEEFFLPKNWKEC